MSDECISPLRQRMIEDMSLRHFGEKTQKDCPSSNALRQMAV
jgi:hypothetical protein